MVGAHNAENNSEEEKAIIKKIMRCMVNYVNGQYSKDQNVVTDAVKTKLESGRSPFLWGTINSITGDSNRILPEVYKTATAS